MDKRKKLVEKLSSYGYIKTERVKDAMLKVPREEFIPPENREYAYKDQPLPIGEGQTISAPHMVAIICETLKLEKGMKVLEIGSGFGYNAAVVAEIIGPEGHLFTTERIESLAQMANKNLKRTGYDKCVTILHTDGTKGLKEEAPFDRIYATASAPHVPEPLKEQLKVGGRLLTPIGTQNSFQELICMLRKGEDKYESHKLGGVAFVPMIGEHGWPEK
ncbi:MAG TPA: protein-L-isoaspartate(D-aspartate) O-methyltransferase [Methanobacterium sp.]|nr:protein-L-isoaspartate(D-aspartate) O-methyltransferase [Methanobacterium sp.]